MPIIRILAKPYYDRNGNSRAGWLLLDGSSVQFVRQERGTADLRAALPPDTPLAESCELEIPAGEFKRLEKLYGGRS